MKNDYERYMNEVWDMKENVYNDFIKSGKKSYIDFLKEELKDVKIKYKNQSRKQTPV